MLLFLSVPSEQVLLGVFLSLKLVSDHVPETRCSVIIIIIIFLTIIFVSQMNPVHALPNPIS